MKPYPLDRTLLLKGKKLAKQEHYRRVKGTKDIMPDAAHLWRFVEAMASDIFGLYGFEEIRTPIFEKTEVFTRSIGETTDIVEKEMYTFTDRGGESLTLRPEGTASAVRAYVENKMHDPPGALKLFYTGPMFRAERPQAGRFRQFHQIGAEVFGSDDPAVDAELIIMLVDFFSELRVPGLKVLINSLGCTECRPGYREALLAFLTERKSELCDNCKGRIDRNPLRVLDCKSPQCQTVIADAPTIDQHRCKPCNDNLADVRRPLQDLEVPHIVDPKLMRGLDYYAGVAFEVTAEGLGAQNAVAGGGRYDALVESFGGPPTPAAGFAIGIERLMLLLEDGMAKSVGAMPPDIYMILLTKQAEERAFEIGHRLRSFGYSVERGYGGGSLKSQMKKADRSKAHFAFIMGEDEVLKEAVTIKNMKTGEQKLAPLADIVEVIDDLYDEESYDDEGDE